LAFLTREVLKKMSRKSQDYKGERAEWIVFLLAFVIKGKKDEEISSSHPEGIAYF
jgi:hypothetical protein